MDESTMERTVAEHDDFDEHDDEQEQMSEEEFEGFLAEAIETFVDESDEIDHVDVATFRDCGVLTMNRGLVVQIGEAEYQITIVRSR